MNIPIFLASYGITLFLLSVLFNIKWIARNFISYFRGIISLSLTPKLFIDLYSSSPLMKQLLEEKCPTTKPK